jgi:hypothetical protein
MTYWLIGEHAVLLEGTILLQNGLFAICSGGTPMNTGQPNSSVLYGAQTLPCWHIGARAMNWDNGLHFEMLSGGELGGGERQDSEDWLKPD